MIYTFIPRSDLWRKYLPFPKGLILVLKKNIELGQGIGLHKSHWSMKSLEQRDSPRSPGELNLHRPPRPAQPRAHGQGGCSERNWGEGKGRAGIVVGVGTVAERTTRSLAVFFLEGRRPGRRRKAQELGVVVSSSCFPAFSSCQRARTWGSPALPSAIAGVYSTPPQAPTKKKNKKKQKPPGMSCPGKRA